MAGTKAGGKKAAAKNLANDPDFYRKIGAKGTTGGFGAYITCRCDLVPGEYHHKAQCAGVKGGLSSRRRKAEKKG